MGGLIGARGSAMRILQLGTVACAAVMCAVACGRGASSALGLGGAGGAAGGSGASGGSGACAGPAGAGGTAGAAGTAGVAGAAGATGSGPDAEISLAETATKLPAAFCAAALRCCRPGDSPYGDIDACQKDATRYTEYSVDTIMDQVQDGLVTFDA